MPLTPDDKKKYKDLYLQTAKPYIADLEKIEKMQTGNAEILEVTHRAAHSLGSQSLMMEYNSIGKLSRLIEKILKSKIDGEFTITDEVRASLVKAVAAIKASVDAIEQTDAEKDISASFEDLSTVSKITV